MVKFVLDVSRLVLKSEAIGHRAHLSVDYNDKYTKIRENK